MREPPFEVRLDRFAVGRAAVVIAAVAAVAAVSGRAGSTAAARADANVASLFAVAAGPAMATIAAARSLLRVAGGVRACRGGGRSVAPQSGSEIAGALTVGLDRVGPSVQRRGLAPDGNSLRCPSPRPIATAARAAPPAG